MQFNDEHFIDKLFASLNVIDRIEILSEVRGYVISPSEFLSHKGSGLVLQPHERSQITPLLLRKINLTDLEISLLLQDGDFFPDFSQNTEQYMSWSRDGQSIIRFVFPSLPIYEELIDYRANFAVTDLLAASAIVVEMSSSLASVNRVFQYERESYPREPSGFAPPKVQVRSGSIEFAVGGGLFASGLGLVVACSAGIVAAPVIGPAIGITLATAGALDLAFNWYKQEAEAQEKFALVKKINAETKRTAAETVKLQAEARKTKTEIELAELELATKKLELEKLRLQQQEGTASRQAYSQLIDRGKVKEIAGQSGFSESYANHLLNRSLPTYLAIKQRSPNIQVDVASESGMQSEWKVRE